MSEYEIRTTCARLAECSKAHDDDAAASEAIGLVIKLASQALLDLHRIATSLEQLLCRQQR